MSDSTHPQSRFFTASPPGPPHWQDMGFGAEAGVLHSRLPWNYFHTSNSATLAPTPHFHQLPIREHPIHEGNPWSLHDPYFWHANQVHDVSTALSASTDVNLQTQHNLRVPLWRPADMQMVPESFPTLSSPTTVNEMHCDDISSVSHPAYHPSPNTFGNSHAAYNPPRALLPNSSGRQPLSPFIKPATHHLGHHLGGPNTNQSLSFSSHVTRSHHPSTSNDQNVAMPPISPHLPSHRYFSPSFPHWFPHHPRPTESIEPDSQFRFLPPQQDSTTSSCRSLRQGARAIEYGGLWLAEEELIKNLTEANGNLNVFQCRWEENRSPCHLWIKGDKSCINTHIQRWHGGKPGGDKLKAKCCWSGCKTTMLKESIARHIVSIHLGEMWECQGCGKETARYDVHRPHTVRSNLEACRTSGALITYSADVRVIDARVALDGGGRLRYADA